MLAIKNMAPSKKIASVSPLVEAVSARFSYYPASTSRTCMDFFRTRDTDVVFAKGAGGGGVLCPPNPTPPRLSSAVQACIQEHTAIKNNCAK